MAGPHTSDQAGFSGPQTALIVGVSYRQLDYWDTTEVVKPALSQAKGSGSRRRYSRSDLLEIGVAKRLRDQGLSLPEVRRILGCVRDAAGSIETDTELVIADGQVHIAHNESELIDLAHRGWGVLEAVSFRVVRDEIDKAIAETLPDKAATISCTAAAAA